MGRNGYFQLISTQDATYVDLYPPVEDGEPIDEFEMEKYFLNKGVQFDKTHLHNSLTGLKEKKTVRLNDRRMTIEPEYMDVDIGVDADKAVVRFYAPTKGGPILDKVDILANLAKSGVKYGIKDDVIDEFCRTREYCKSFVMAEGVPMVHGKSAKITYMFNTDISRKPKMLDDGSVNFHDLDTVSHINAGDIIAKLEPAVQGKPGIDVMGRAIKPEKVKVLFLKMVKNTRLSPDGLTLISEVSGHASIVDGQLFVSDTFVVPGNVDTSTGDINYSGNVEVKGNVITGFRIEATGDVIVDGVVEGAEIVAGGQIVLKRGIQGMSRGVLKAGTNIVAKFIESAEVEAGGYLRTESIMHSKVVAGGEITVLGRKGFISGGSIRSGMFVEAKVAGSTMGTTTNIEVGCSITLAAEAHSLEKEREETKEKIASADKTVAFLTKKLKGGEGISKDKLANLAALSSGKKQLQEHVAKIEERLQELYKLMDNSNNGYILVDDVIYPGCKLTISNVSTFIRTETKHCRLVRDGADIRVKPY